MTDRLRLISEVGLFDWLDLERAVVEVDHEQVKVHNELTTTNQFNTNQWNSERGGGWAIDEWVHNNLVRFIYVALCFQGRSYPIRWGEVTWQSQAAIRAYTGRGGGKTSNLVNTNQSYCEWVG